MSFISAVARMNIDLMYSGMGRLPQEGEEIYAADFDIQLGGGPVATLTNLQRLNVPVRILTFLGQDMFSAFGAAELTRHGVEYHNLHKTDGVPVNISTVMITDRDRTFVSYNGARENFSEALTEAAWELMRGSKIVEMQPGFLDLYKRLKREGTILIFDLGWEDDLSFRKYRAYFELADYFTPNLKEALHLTGQTDPLEALKTLGEWFPRPIVKMGNRGCLIRDRDEIFLVPHITEFQAVDATGAGDAFLSGFMYGLYHHAGFQKSILYGNITGGLAVTEIGCLTASVSELDLFAYTNRYADRIIKLDPAKKLPDFSGS